MRPFRLKRGGCFAAAGVALEQKLRPGIVSRVLNGGIAMRLSSLVAGAALIVASVSLASAFPHNDLVVPTAEVKQVHHKPGHMGGPPWLRRNSPGLGHHYGWDRRRVWERRDRLIERRRVWRGEWDAPWSTYGRWHD